MTTVETPKRYAPTRETLRELYLKSGNRCAFPGCGIPLFNSKGNFVGQICHIEAAAPGGERFNPRQTNEQRRHVSNLVLMCYEHHIETNDVSKFPVATMARIKAEHEKIYTDVVGEMLLKVRDHTKLTDVQFPVNLNKLGRALAWSLTEEEVDDALVDLRDTIGRLAKVPRPSRELLQIIIERGSPGEGSTDLHCSIPELQQATNLTSRKLRECFSILNKHHFTHDCDKDDFGAELVGIPLPPSGWSLWRDLRKFAKRTGVGVGIMVVGLDFSMLGD